MKLLNNLELKGSLNKELYNNKEDFYNNSEDLEE